MTQPQDAHEAAELLRLLYDEVTPEAIAFIREIAEGEWIVDIGAQEAAKAWLAARGIETDP